MVNAHCHSELSYLRGKIAPGGGFAEFARTISAVRHESTPEERLSAADYWNARMYREGVTAVGDICNGDTTFALKKKSAIYYHSFIEYFGLAVTDFSRTDSIAGEARQAGLPCSVTPHATYSLQDASFRRIAAEGDLLSIHFMESRAETELFHNTGPLYQQNREKGTDIDFVHYGSPGGRITASVPRDKNILLVHNTFADHETVERIEDHFTRRPTWVLCPRSNRHIENAVPPVNMLRSAGVRIAVGTDSLASNEDLSLIEELKMFRDVPLRELFTWATVNGAEALGIADRAGSFEPGKKPGAVLVTGIDWERGCLTPGSQTRRIL